MVLLANLARQPAHGYELRKQVEESTGQALSNNSLYPTLRRFHDAGAVTRTAQEQQGKPPRHIYEITDIGRELLHDMLADLPEDLAGEQAEFLARLANFSLLDVDERLRVVDARHRALTRRRERMTQLCAAAGDPWTRLALTEVCDRVATEQDWLTTVRAKAIELEGDQP